MDYKQPDFYHFSEDSLKLVKATLYLPQMSPINLLDIGAGCGVLAIECANQHKSITKIVMLEPQSEFLEFIDYNLVHQLKRDVLSERLNTSFAGFITNQKYDLIICNPPYFEKGAGRKSPSLQKQTCRTFELDGPEVYMKKIISLLSPNGRGFILIPHNVNQWDRVLAKFSSRLKELERLNGVSIFLIS
tara:strand:- start:373 stop:939 length:567 start_codon:yes stop_codon:yes gene_type:complete